MSLPLFIHSYFLLCTTTTSVVAVSAGWMVILLFTREEEVLVYNSSSSSSKLPAILIVLSPAAINSAKIEDHGTKTTTDSQNSLPSARLRGTTSQDALLQLAYANVRRRRQIAHLCRRSKSRHRKRRWPLNVRHGPEDVRHSAADDRAQPGPKHRPGRAGGHQQQPGALLCLAEGGQRALVHAPFSPPGADHLRDHRRRHL